MLKTAIDHCILSVVKESNNLLFKRLMISVATSGLFILLSVYLFVLYLPFLCVQGNLFQKEFFFSRLFINTICHLNFATVLKCDDASIIYKKVTPFYSICTHYFATHNSWLAASLSKLHQSNTCTSHHHIKTMQILKLSFSFLPIP